MAEEDYEGRAADAEAFVRAKDQTDYLAMKKQIAVEMSKATPMTERARRTFEAVQRMPKATSAAVRRQFAASARLLRAGRSPQDKPRGC